MSRGTTAHNGHLAPHLVVVFGALSAFAPLSIDTYLPGLPSLEREFHAGASAVQSTLTACLLGLALGQVLIGPLSDRFGRRRPLLLGIAVFAIASFGGAVAPDLWALVLLRFVQGVAGAAGLVVTRAVVRDITSGSAALRLFSLLQVVNGAFPALAPVVGAQLLRVGSWRLVFVVLGSVGLLLLLVTWRSVTESLPPAARATGTLGATLRPMARLCRDRTFVGYALVTGFIFGAMFAYISGSPFVLETLEGLSAQAYSGVFAMNALGIVAASQLAVFWSSRMPPARILSIGAGTCAVGAGGLLVSAVAHLGLGSTIASLFVTVAAVGVVLPSGTALAMADQGEVAGSASGVLGILQFVIGAAAAPLVGLFGAHSATPMAGVIACLAALALLTRMATPTPVHPSEPVPVEG